MHVLKHAILATCIIGVSATGAAFAADPYTKLDGTSITISGKVESVSRDSFILDYGKGMIMVEMDDGDRDADGYKLLKGDKVTVNGLIDDDLFEKTKIEASSVYVDNINTYFFASSLDEEDGMAIVTSLVPISSTVVQGTVTAVGDDEFTLDTGSRKLQVEVEDMTYNPLDDEGYQKIRLGDRVNVMGEMETEFFDGRVLEADSVIKLTGK